MAAPGRSGSNPASERGSCYPAVPSAHCCGSWRRRWLFHRFTHGRRLMTRVLTTLGSGLLLPSLWLALMPTQVMGQADFDSNPVLYRGPRDLFGTYTGRPGSVSASSPSFQLLADGYTISGPAYTVTAPVGTADITTIWSADRLYQGTVDFGRIFGETAITTSGFDDFTTMTLEVHGRTVQYETDAGGIDFATITQSITGNGTTSVRLGNGRRYPSRARQGRCPRALLENHSQRSTRWRQCEPGLELRDKLVGGAGTGVVDDARFGRNLSLGLLLHSAHS